MCSFCYVDLADGSQLKAALKLNGTEFNGSDLTIELARKKGDAAVAAPEAKKTEKAASKGKGGGDEAGDKGRL